MIVENKLIGSRTSQSLFENATWNRIIEFLSQENTFMKNRLSEVIDQIHDRDDLALAEHYQNQFIIKDDLFDHMLHNLNEESEKWSNPTFISTEENIHLLQKTHDHLRDQMEFIEKDVAMIRKDYNIYLSKILLAFNAHSIK